MALLALAASLAAPAARAQPACGAAAAWRLSAARLTVSNTGAAPCQVPALPVLTFRDAAGNPLPIDRHALPGLHTGVVAVVLAPGGTAATTLGWAESGGICLGPATLSAGTARPIAFPHAVCGKAGAPLPVSQPPLQSAR